METTQVFHTADGFTRLWTITWDRIDEFLPDFRHNLFRSHPPCKFFLKEKVVLKECSWADELLRWVLLEWKKDSSIISYAVAVGCILSNNLLPQNCFDLKSAMEDFPLSSPKELFSFLQTPFCYWCLVSVASST